MPRRLLPGDLPLFASRTQYGAVVIVAIVLLRLAIGWHFFKEGSKKIKDPKFTSAHFLRLAKGPSAAFFKNQIPDNYGHIRLDPATLNERVAEWEDYRAEVADHYGFDKAQEAESKEILEQRTQQLRDFFADNADDLYTHFQNLDRYEEWLAQPAREHTPHETRWMEKLEGELQSKAIGWTKTVDTIREGLETDLNALADEEQYKEGPKKLGESYGMPIDRVVTILTFAVGICLMLGLFVRPAAVAGMLFLLMVMATQPPWVPGAEPVYYQSIEFLALFVLAAVGAGRWGGLDYLLGLACQKYCGSCCKNRCAK